MGRGGFYPPLSVVLPPLMAACVVIGFRASRYAIGLIAASALFLGWWMFTAISNGSVERALPLFASIAMFGCAAIIGERADGSERRRIGAVMVALGAIGTVLGMAGVTFDIFPLATKAHGQLSASWTFGYSNSAGLFAAMVVPLVATLQRPRTRAMLAWLVAAGVGSSLSRGALLAMAIAILVAGWKNVRPIVTPSALGVLGGMAIALLPGWGLLAALLLLGVVVIAPKVPATFRRSIAVTALLGVAIASLAAPVVRVWVTDQAAIGQLAGRSYEWEAAMDVFLGAPLVGAGAEPELVLDKPGGPTTSRFAHNEVLEIAASAGLIGLLLLAGLVFVVGRAMWRMRPLGPQARCAAGCIVAFVVSGMVDFTWHVPAIGALAGWAAGLASSGAQDG